MEDAPARWIRRRPGDPGAAQRLRVDPRRVAIDPAEHDGAVRNDAIERLLGGELLGRPEVLIPATPADPLPGRALRRRLGDLLRGLLGALHAAQREHLPR